MPVFTFGSFCYMCMVQAPLGAMQVAYIDNQEEGCKGVLEIPITICVCQPDMSHLRCL